MKKVKLMIRSDEKDITGSYLKYNYLFIEMFQDKKKAQFFITCLFNFISGLEKVTSYKLVFLINVSFKLHFSVKTCLNSTLTSK